MRIETPDDRTKRIFEMPKYEDGMTWGQIVESCFKEFGYPEHCVQRAMTELREIGCVLIFKKSQRHARYKWNPDQQKVMKGEAQIVKRIQANLVTTSFTRHADAISWGMQHCLGSAQ